MDIPSVKYSYLVPSGSWMDISSASYSSPVCLGLIHAPCVGQAILSQSFLIPSSKTLPKMSRMSISEAMQLLSLHDGFSMNDLRKQYYRLSLRVHPDKGGSTQEMQKAVAARNLLFRTAELRGTGGAQNPHPEVPRPVMSPSPSPARRQEATAYGLEFFTALRKKDDQHALQLYNLIRTIARNTLLDKVMKFGWDCVELMARHQVQQYQLKGPQTWEAIGFKYLSYQGFDVTPSGRGIIDYGNREYLCMLEFMSLRKHGRLDSLASLQNAWPAHMDLWAVTKTKAQIERLADVVEIIMGALRSEPWFSEVWEPVHAERKYQLQDMFTLFVSLCRLVQTLNARLVSGYLKFKFERVYKFTSLANHDFSRRWSDPQPPFSRGLLLFGLLQAAEQA